MNIYIKLLVILVLYNFVDPINVVYTQNIFDNYRENAFDDIYKISWSFL